MKNQLSRVEKSVSMRGCEFIRIVTDGLKIFFQKELFIFDV